MPKIRVDFRLPCWNAFTKISESHSNVLLHRSTAISASIVLPFLTLTRILDPEGKFWCYLKPIKGQLISKANCKNFLEARTEIKKYFRCFLVQMKGLELAFEINWPLGTYDLHLLIILKLKINPCGLGSTSNSRFGGILIQNRNQNNYFVPLCLMIWFTDFIKRKNQTARNNIFWTYLVSK